MWVQMLHVSYAASGSAALPPSTQSWCTFRVLAPHQGLLRAKIISPEHNLDPSPHGGKAMTPRRSLSSGKVPAMDIYS